MMRTVTERAPAGSERAAGGIEDLYRQHVDDALELAYLLTGDRGLAEDLVHGAFVKVFGRFHDLRNRDAFWWARPSPSSSPWWDPEGTLVTAEAFPLIVPEEPMEPIASPAATGPTGTTDAIPSAVLAARDAIASAAEMRDFDALEALIDPDRFSYDFDDGSNPVPIWREDPSVLDTLVTVLQMPFTTTEGTPDVGTIYVWPSLVDADLTDLTAEQRIDFSILGFTEQDVRDMLDAFGGYAGPRTAIAEDGTWLSYTIGGD
jgi:hypothetical protein